MQDSFFEQPFERAAADDPAPQHRSASRNVSTDRPSTPADVVSDNTRVTPGGSGPGGRVDEFHLDDDEIRREAEHLALVLWQRIDEIEAIFDVVPIGLGIADDSECSSIRLNPALMQMLGADPELSAGITRRRRGGEALSLRYFRNGTEIRSEELPMQVAARRGEDVQMIVDVETPDGRLITTWQAARPLYDAQGQLRGSVVAVTDMTEQARDTRHAKFLVRASEILASSFDARRTLTTLSRLVVPEVADLYTIDLVSEQGQTERVCARANGVGDESVVPPFPPLHTIPEHPANDVLRTGVPYFTDGRDGVIAEQLTHRPQLLEQYRALELTSLIIVPMEARGRMLGVLTAATCLPSGTRTQARTRARARFDRKDLVFLAELARRAASAVDHAQLLETAERARQEAQAASRAKSDFLAMMSHELRTPLNAIAGYTQLMAMGLRGPLTDAQRDDLQRIQLSQRHLLSLINSVLNFVKLDAGSVQYDMQRVDVNEVIHGVEPMIRPQLEAKGVHYVHRGSRAPLLVTVDVDKTRQILLNLLSNALKFTPLGGAVTVESRAMRAGIAIIVRDNGVGIAPEKVARIFDPFVQVDRTLSTTHEGVGLGLTISRELARAMDGDITVASELGRGTTFTVMFPRSSAEDE